MTYALPAPDQSLTGLSTFWHFTSERTRIALRALEREVAAEPFIDFARLEVVRAEYKAACAADDAAWREYQAAMQQRLSELQQKISQHDSKESV